MQWIGSERRGPQPPDPQINRFGTPDVLGIVDVPEPEPGAGEVLIRTVATSINPVDDKTREGAIGEGTPPLPTVAAAPRSMSLAEAAASGCSSLVPLV